MPDAMIVGYDSPRLHYARPHCRSCCVTFVRQGLHQVVRRLFLMETRRSLETIFALIKRLFLVLFPKCLLIFFAESLRKYHDANNERWRESLRRDGCRWTIPCKRHGSETSEGRRKLANFRGPTRPVFAFTVVTKVEIPKMPFIHLLSEVENLHACR